MKSEFMTAGKLREAYLKGENIAALLRGHAGGENPARVIEMAYDLQAGSYVRALDDPSRMAFKERYAAELNKIFSELGRPSSVFEAGVGEATTLSYVLKGLGGTLPAVGVDISWSRLKWAKKWLAEQEVAGVLLAVADLENLPLADAAIDIVYTSHSIEPNRGREREILAELYRVTGRYLVLLEPGYELAHEKARARMDQHGYCRDLPGHAQSLGMKVLRHELFPLTANPDNPTALTLIQKTERRQGDDLNWYCPVSGKPLIEKNGFWYSDESMLAYPILGGLPCLRSEKGIVASQFLEAGL